MERLRAIFSSTWFRRLTIGLYTAIVAAIVGIYIGISLLDVQTAAFVRGSATLEKGRSNAVRGVIIDAPTGQFHRDLEARFSLRPPDSNPKDSGPGEVLDSVRPGPGGVLRAALRVPAEVEPGPYDLVLRVTGTEIEPFEAASRVTVGESESGEPAWLPKTSRISDAKRREKFSSGAVESQSGEIAIEMLPPDGEIPRGLPDEVYLLTYDAETGAPVSCEVSFDEVEGMGQWGRSSEKSERIETDAMGLAAVPIEAVGGQKWRLSAEEIGGETDTDEQVRHGRATLRLHTVASQMSMSARSRLVSFNGTVEGTVDTLLRSGQLNLDVYRGRSWLVAESTPLRDRKSAYRLEIPEPEGPEDWLYRLQVSRGVYDTGDGWDVVHLLNVASADKSKMRNISVRLVDFIAENRPEHAYFGYLAESGRLQQVSASQQQLVSWSEAWLEGLSRHYSRPGTLFNSQKSDRKELEAWKDEVQADLMVFIVLALIAGFAVILYVVLAGLKRKREHDRRLREVDIEMAGRESTDGEEAVDHDPGRASELMDGLLGLIALATIIMFALGLIYLLSYM